MKLLDYEKIIQLKSDIDNLKDISKSLDAIKIKDLIKLDFITLNNENLCLFDINILIKIYNFSCEVVSSVLEDKLTKFNNIQIDFKNDR